MTKTFKELRQEAGELLSMLLSAVNQEAQKYIEMSDDDLKCEIKKVVEPKWLEINTYDKCNDYLWCNYRLALSYATIVLQVTEEQMKKLYSILSMMMNTL